MNDEIKEILSYLKKKENTRRIKCITIEESKQLLEYITNLQQENERLKETNVYCNRTDCIGRIKDSKKYDSVYQEKEDYKSRCEKAKNKLSFIDEALENDILNVPLCITKINSALNILQGENNGN